MMHIKQSQSNDSIDKTWTDLDKGSENEPSLPPQQLCAKFLTVKVISQFVQASLRQYAGHPDEVLDWHRLLRYKNSKS